MKKRYTPNKNSAFNKIEDLALIKKAKKDKVAYGKLYEKYSGKIYGYFYNRLNFEKETSEDLMQETFLRAFEHLSQFKDMGQSYLSYLFAIAHNILVNYYRSNKSSSFENIDDLSDQIELEKDITKKLDIQLGTQAMWKAADSLSDNERNIFIMRYQDYMSVREISYKTHKSENAVKLSLSRGRKKIISHPFMANISIGNKKLKKKNKSPRKPLIMMTPFWS